MVSLNKSAARVSDTEWQQWVLVMFWNIYVVKNHRITNNSDRWSYRNEHAPIWIKISEIFWWMLDYNLLYFLITNPSYNQVVYWLKHSHIHLNRAKT